MKKWILIMFALLLVGCQQTIEEEVVTYDFAEPIEVSINDHMKIRVDPEVELTYMLFEFIADRTDFHLYNTKSYVMEQEVYFDAYKDHEILDHLESMAKSGFTYDTIPRLLYHYDHDINLEENVIVDEALMERIGGQEQAEAFLKALRDFRIESEYDRYFEGKRAYYEEEMARGIKHIQQSGMSDVYYDFYGESLGDIIVVVTPDCNNGFGVLMSYEDKQVLMPTLTVVRNEEAYVGFLLHELSHQFVNPKTSENMETVNELEPLFEPIREKMSQMAYPMWETTVNEHIVRANVIAMMTTIYGDLKREVLVYEEKEKAFIYIENILETLNEFEMDRATYPTFRSFYPVILENMKLELNEGV